jgi:hypothetical protein
MEYGRPKTAPRASHSNARRKLGAMVLSRSKWNPWFMTVLVALPFARLTPEMNAARKGTTCFDQGDWG